MEKKERKSNFEILRILAMVLIISYHFVFHSNYNYGAINAHDFILRAFWLFGEIGVNLFMLISGYFMVHSKFSWKKVIRLVLEVNFYYIIGVILSNHFSDADKIDFNTTKKIFLNGFPVLNNVYWFTGAYILVYIFSPYINTMIKGLSQKDYQKLLMIVLVIWSIVPTILGYYTEGAENALFFSRMIWLIVVYLIGGYIRIYNIKFLDRKRNASLGAIISFGVELLLMFILWRKNSEEVNPIYFWGPNSVMQIALSISIFMIFKNINVKSNVIINKIASTTLGVYLLHEGPIENVWSKVFNYHDTMSLPLGSALLDIFRFVLIIFSLGICIDLIRQLLEKFIVNPILDKLFELNNKKSKE